MERDYSTDATEPDNCDYLPLTYNEEDARKAASEVETMLQSALNNSSTSTEGEQTDKDDDDNVDDGDRDVEASKCQQEIVSEEKEESSCPEAIMGEDPQRQYDGNSALSHCKAAGIQVLLDPFHGQDRLHRCVDKKHGASR